MAAIARDKGIDPHDIELWFADEARIDLRLRFSSTGS
jgi:hypothetical protein